MLYFTPNALFRLYQRSVQISKALFGVISILLQFYLRFTCLAGRTNQRTVLCAHAVRLWPQACTALDIFPWNLQGVVTAQWTPLTPVSTLYRGIDHGALHT